MSRSLGIWLVRPSAEAIGTALAQRLQGQLYRPWTDDAPHKEQFRRAFNGHPSWVLVMASGIAARFIDGLVHDKHRDPAVVVLDEAARFAISFLGGHEAGANTLAYEVANVTGATPVITTATEALKPLVVGIGCRQGVSAEQIAVAVERALAGRPLSEVREVATIREKEREPGLRAFCDANALPLRVVATEQIAARAWVTQPSAWVRQTLGIDGVCEPSALIACPRGALIVPKTTGDGVAVAVVADRPWEGPV